MAKPKQDPESFEEFLKKKGKGEADIDWNAVLQLWNQAAKGLVDLVAGWLQPLEAKELVRMERISWQVNEEQFGTYGLPALKLQFRGSPLVTLRPVGKHILGAAGRYDLECGLAKYYVLLTGKGTWQIVHSVRRGKPVPLDQAAFEAAVRELVSA